MAIQKQEFYEGAAIHQLVRAGNVKSIRYTGQLFILNEEIAVLLKHCTRGRSPWGFTFTSEERLVLQKQAEGSSPVIGLICASDGIALCAYDVFLDVAGGGHEPVRLSCFRKHGEYYELKGPNGSAEQKVPPSEWRNLLG